MYFGFPAFDSKCANCAGPLTDGDVSMDNDQDKTSAESIDIEDLLFGEGQDIEGGAEEEEDIVSEEPTDPSCDFCGLEISEAEIPDSCPRCQTSFVFESDDDEDESEDDSEDDSKKKKRCQLS